MLPQKQIYDGRSILANAIISVRELCTQGMNKKNPTAQEYVL